MLRNISTDFIYNAETFKLCREMFSFICFRYNEVVRACALLSDFDQLPAGDQTEIGERGV